MKTTLLSVTLISLMLVGTNAAIADKNCKHKQMHGAKMFKKMDTNQDGMISKAEFMKKSEEHFNKMDTNGDGQISKEEMQEHRKMMKMKFHEKHKPMMNNEQSS